MYEKPYTGLTAELKLNDVVLAYMSGFDLNLEKNIIEILQFGARYTEKVPAVKDWSANVDHHRDDRDTLPIEGDGIF